MWFIKRNFIAFYKDGKYKLLRELFKKDNVIEKEKKEFEKEELEKYILEQIDEYPQTYTSTIAFTLNQGVIKGCSKQAYLQNEIDYSNVKILCFEKYSFYISIFDLQKIKKDFPFLDFIYSPFAIIDYLAKERKNRFYLLIFEEYIALLAYEQFIPIFSDLIELKKEEEKEEIEDIDLMDEIEEIEDIEEITEDITEDIDNIDEEALEEKLNEVTSGNESKILQIIQDALKTYYENYSSDFIEKIILLDTTSIDPESAKIIEDEVLIECEYKKIDILEIINRISRESL